MVEADLEEILLESEQKSLLFYSIFNLSFRVAGFVFTLGHVMSWHWSCDIGCDRHKSLGSNKRRKSKKKKLRKSLQFGKRPIVPWWRPFWSVKWHMCVILIGVEFMIFYFLIKDLILAFITQVASKNINIWNFVLSLT